MCQQKNSDGASLWEEKACPDCSMTNIQPEVGLERLVDLSTISNGNTYPRLRGKKAGFPMRKLHRNELPASPLHAWKIRVGYTERDV